MYEYKAATWKEAWEKCISAGYPIYVTIAKLGTHKLYPTGYSRRKLPNEIMPKGTA